MVGFWIYDISLLILFTIWVFWFLGRKKDKVTKEGNFLGIPILMYRTQLGMKAIKYIGDNFKKTFYNYVDTIDTPFKIILISKQVLTEQDRKKILTQLVPNELEEIGRNIEVELFNELELQYDPTFHDLVPKHIILTKEEKKIINFDQKKF